MTMSDWPVGLSKEETAVAINRYFDGTMMGHLTMRLLEVSTERVIAEMPVDAGAKGLLGAAHTGAMATLADSAATIAAITTSGDASPEHFPMAIGLSIQIVGNVQEGVLHAESRVTHPGRTIMVIDTKVTSDQGRLLATVTTTHFIRR